MSSGTQPRSLKERWANGESTLGAWCMMPGALGVESVGSLGFDWVLIDMQHGCMAFEGALEMIRAADLHDMAPIVRVPWNEPGIIGRVELYERFYLASAPRNYSLAHTMAQIRREWTAVPEFWAETEAITKAYGLSGRR